MGRGVYIYILFGEDDPSIFLDESRKTHWIGIRIILRENLHRKPWSFISKTWHFLIFFPQTHPVNEPRGFVNGDF